VDKEYLNIFRVEYKVKNINKTDFALQFEIKIGSSWEEVDLIPIANIAEDRKYDLHLRVLTL
jgi:hypothetical protein